MKIRRAQDKDLQGLYEFNHRQYPERSNYKEIVDFWVSRKKNEINNFVLAVGDNDEIKGQQFFSTMSYFYEGNKVDSVWAFDLIVDEDLRSASQGFALMWKCKKEHPNSMSSGSNDNSMRINIKIGNKHIGNLKKYVGLFNPLRLVTSLFRGTISAAHFPDKLTAGNNLFEKTNEMPSYTSPFNADLLEIGREKDFMDWRFGSTLHEYVVYKSADADDYFVVRTIVKKHITALVLIDYRCVAKDSIAFENILKALKKLAGKLHLAMVIVGSSLSNFDAACEKHGLKAVGRDRPILGFVNTEGKQDAIDNRNFVFLTLADSDGDTTW